MMKTSKNINDEEGAGILEKGCLGEKLKIHSITKISANFNIDDDSRDKFIVTLKSVESDNWFAVKIPIQDDGILGNVFEIVRLQ